jgi:hypothetical protein
MKYTDPRIEELKQLRCDKHHALLSVQVRRFENGDASVRYDACCNDLRARAKAIVDPPATEGA